MADAQATTSFGLQKRYFHKRIRCGCPSRDPKEIERLHGFDRHGNLNRCPTPRSIENLGEGKVRDQLIHDYGCKTWDEFQTKHRLRAWLFMKANDLHEQFELLKYGAPIPINDTISI